MEHPLIGNIDDLTVDELNSKISDLNNKLNIVMRTGNGNLCNQIRMALETYQTKYQEKLQASYKREGGDVNFDNKINIK
jgi:hypothetical protein